MTDKIYYKVQYPIKKSIKVLKNIEPEEVDEYDFSDSEKEKIKSFLNKWENGAKLELENLIKDLRKA
ncbi:MAG TPA: hypothetical protein VJ881_07250 [Halanaerobiales bacterium]|nr:hypothetical protein [Halanaerobiales bacterium]